ncbi:hypothetical protein TCDM_07057 [Trypanosoma cruzi Dm28c]|uniref:Uncharacterized protein n=1 Tax=Trypanosoma cruzi Dm28c TaxID=1416333 RepID=V5DBE9_TRYCR|nr:hypothetical protein TCDM_07057 [Trypanosoma cruzi Dm28c]
MYDTYTTACGTASLTFRTIHTDSVCLLDAKSPLDVSRRRLCSRSFSTFNLAASFSSRRRSSLACTVAFSTPASCASQKPTSSAVPRPSDRSRQARAKRRALSSASSLAALCSTLLSSICCSTSCNCIMIPLACSSCVSCRCVSPAAASRSSSTEFFSKRTPRSTTRAAVRSSNRTCTESRSKSRGIAKSRCRTSSPSSVPPASSPAGFPPVAVTVAGRSTLATRRTYIWFSYTVTASACESVRITTLPAVRSSSPPTVIRGMDAVLSRRPKSEVKGNNNKYKSKNKQTNKQTNKQK